MMSFLGLTFLPVLWTCYRKPVDPFRDQLVRRSWPEASHTLPSGALFPSSNPRPRERSWRWCRRRWTTPRLCPEPCSRRWPGSNDISRLETAAEKGDEPNKLTNQLCTMYKHVFSTCTYNLTISPVNLVNYLNQLLLSNKTMYLRSF